MWGNLADGPGRFCAPARPRSGKVDRLRKPLLAALVAGGLRAGALSSPAPAQGSLLEATVVPFQPLSVEVSGTDITVRLATDAAGDRTSTAAEVVAALPGTAPVLSLTKGLDPASGSRLSTLVAGRKVAVSPAVGEQICLMLSLGFSRRQTAAYPG